MVRFLLLGLVFLVTPVSAVAATKSVAKIKPIYAAALVKRSATTIKVLPGDMATFSIVFKNTGPTVWTNTGRNFVSVYDVTAKKTSKFYDAESWLGENQPTALRESGVSKKQSGTFSLVLYAPLESGSYSQKFRLAAEGVGFIPGGAFTVKIVVMANRWTKTGSLPDKGSVLVKPALGYRANKLIISDTSLKLLPGATKTVRVGFKNTGKVAWTVASKKSLTIRATSTDATLFKDKSWSSSVVSTLGSDIKPGTISFFTIPLSAPSASGVYQADFTLMAGDEVVPGGGIELPIEVESGLVPGQIDKLEESIFAASGPRGPVLRVGLLNTTSPVVIVAPGAYSLVDGNGNLIKQISGTTTTTYDFSSGIYTVQNGIYTYSSNQRVRFVPQDQASSIFSILSYENRPTWDTSVNFNQFRGNLEIGFAKATGKLWLIEEVPTEDYLLGLGETSNASPAEFQKALVTAARTYALFVKSIGGKHKSEFFDLDTTGNDQVYKGYVSELVRPNVVSAANFTRGAVVTYNNDIVVTPYFSRSDGRTRSWSEVWYGERPWLISKPATYDLGKTLWGHGVGMSASDALGRANAGETWLQILSYYYTGIAIKQLY